MNPAAPSALPGLAVMLSGAGRTMLNIARACADGVIPARVNLVIASGNTPGAQRAKDLGLPVLVVPGVIDQAVLERILRDHAVTWIALAGYLKKVNIPQGFQGRVVNIHPALLPAFGGAGMYGERVQRAVLDAGCKVSGCTVHMCDAEYDRGPIVAQQACEVLDTDTPQTLAQRVFALETALYPRALADLVAGRIAFDGHRARAAT